MDGGSYFSDDTACLISGDRETPKKQYSTLKARAESDTSANLY